MSDSLCSQPVGMHIRRLLMDLLSYEITGDSPESFSDCEDWDMLYHLSIDQDVCALAGSAVMRLLEGGDSSLSIEDERWENTKYSWCSELIAAELRYEEYLSDVSSLADLFSTNDIPVIVLKGIGLSAKYPTPAYRNCSDFDCYLGCNYELGNKLVEQRGICIDYSTYLHSSFIYNNLHVENHKYLLGLKSNQTAKDACSILEDLLTSQGVHYISSSNMCVGGELFQLFYVTCHAHKHLLTERLTLKMICDMAVLIRGLSQSFCWNQYWSYCEECGLYRFAQSYVGMASRLCGVDIPGFVCKQEDIQALENSLFLDHSYYKTESGTAWRKRISMARNIMHRRNLYKLFSSQSAMSTLINMLVGHFSS